MVLAAALGVWAFINGRFLFAGYHALVASARVRGLPLLPPPLSGERLLVLAPHPDDEVLAAGGSWGGWRGKGEVRVVYLTSGDAFDLAAGSPLPSPKALRRLALRRMVEARRGLGPWAFPRKAPSSWAFPTRASTPSLPPTTTCPTRAPTRGLRRWPTRGATGRASPTRGRPWRPSWWRSSGLSGPPGFSCQAPWTPTGTTRPRPTSACGRRPFSAWRTASSTTSSTGGTSTPCPRASTLGFPSTRPSGRGLPWQRFPLSEEEVRRKERAVRAHKSQMRLLSRFLLAFVRENELYNPLPVPAREALAAEEEGWAVLPERGEVF